MEINKSELQKALETVRPGLANREIIEQSTSFAFIENEIVTYNDQISIAHPIKNLNITGAVQAEELYHFITKVKREEINIEIENNELHLKSGRSKIWLTLKQEIILPLESIEKRGKWKELPVEFSQHLKFAAASCSSDFSDIRYTAVHVKDNIIEGSDRYRITKCKLENALETEEFLLPATSAIEVAKLNPIKIASGDGWIHFLTSEETLISCRLISTKDKYPDTSPFTKGKGTVISLSRKLKETLDRAAPFAKRDHILDEKIDLELRDAKLIVTAKSDVGRFEETLNINYHGEEVIKFSIIPYLLNDIISQTLQCTICENKLKFEGENWTYVTVLTRN